MSDYVELNMEKEVARMAMPAWVPEAWGKLNADNQKQAKKKPVVAAELK